MRAKRDIQGQGVTLQSFVVARENRPCDLRGGRMRRNVPGGAACNVVIDET